MVCIQRNCIIYVIKIHFKILLIVFFLFLLKQKIKNILKT